MYNQHFSLAYDRFVNWTNRLSYELPFIESQLELVGGKKARVLDAATGTGMHAVALAQLGYTAAGADISQSMLAQARRNHFPIVMDMAFLQGMERVLYRRRM